MNFLKYFIWKWKEYAHFMAYIDRFKKEHPEEYRKSEENDRAKGIKPYKNRFDFAFRNAKIYYAHRKDYKRCLKYKGNCEKCSRCC